MTPTSRRLLVAERARLSLSLFVFLICNLFPWQSEYKSFPGMYPHAAGLIASNGPYNTVKDIFKIKEANSNDIAMFKKYEKEFMVNPPGRMFDERINERVST